MQDKNQITLLNLNSDKTIKEQILILLKRYIEEKTYQEFIDLFSELQKQTKLLNIPQAEKWNLDFFFEYHAAEEIILEVLENKRADIFDWIWDNYYLNFFTKFDKEKSIYDLCRLYDFQEMKNHILKKCQGVILFTEAFRLNQMKENTICSISASSLRDFLGIKAFHKKGRGILKDFCDKHNLEYAVSDKSTTEEYLYNRYLTKWRRSTSENYEQMERMLKSHPDIIGELPNKEEWIEKRLKDVKSWWGTLTFFNEPILSKHSVVFITKDFIYKSKFLNYDR